jgi:hypothetical protein
MYAGSAAPVGPSQKVSVGCSAKFLCTHQSSVADAWSAAVIQDLSRMRQQPSILHLAGAYSVYSVERALCTLCTTSIHMSLRLLSALQCRHPRRLAQLMPCLQNNCHQTQYGRHTTGAMCLAARFLQAGGAMPSAYQASPSITGGLFSNALTMARVLRGTNFLEE